jgi:hypothetical protein
MLKSILVLTSSTTALLILCFSTQTYFKTEANSAPLNPPRAFENYDIRRDRSPAAIEKLRTLRGTIRSNIPHPDMVSDVRFEIDFDDDLGVAEIVSPATPGAVLASGKGGTRAEALRDFIRANRPLFGIDVVSGLVKVADYSNPAGNLAFAHFRQETAGVPVFGAEAKAGFDRSGRMFRVVNSLAPGLETSASGANFGSAERAVINASSQIGIVMATADLTALQSQKRDDHRFSSSAFAGAVSAKRFYFPVGNGVAVPAWRVFLVTDSAAYYVVVDAVDGTLLWRKHLIEMQTLPATYSVYGNTTSFLKTADSPSPFSPGCQTPVICPQPPAVPRTAFTFVGNETPYTFNNLGWIPDTGLPVRTPANPNITDGNNVEAGIDRIGPSGVDDNGWAFGSPTRVFGHAYNPAPGIPPPGEEPVPGMQTYPPSDFQQGVVAHGFYTANRWHDEMYRLGFTEQAGNFQHFNFGRGGSEGDRLSFEIQDGSGTNGANFLTPADGERARMQMFVWTGATPNRDGALDAQVVTHEMTHGLSGRLHGNATGLASNMARGMGEGWSDLFSAALFSEPGDDRFGTYAVGGYVSYMLIGTGGFEANYYYGIRRFPLAVWASRGPNGLPHNPLTLRYINSGCSALIGTTMSNPNSAYPRGPLGSAGCDQVHNLGEFWAVTLWEVRDQLIQRHGDAEGNRRILQYVTDAMKLSPINPTLVQSRDAVIIAATFSDPSDVRAVWRGFAIRGLGVSAAIINPGTGSNNTVVTEAFDIPIQFRRPARADFDGDGRTDVSVFRPSDGVWYLNRSFSGFTAARWGLATDDPVPADFDGDGKTDIAVFRATSDGSMPDFYILQSATLTVSFVSWGTTGDIALTEDFDGDDKHDPTVFRPSTGQFWVRRSTDGAASTFGPFGGGFMPIVGDWDGDNRADFGMFSNGAWRMSRSSTDHAVVVAASWGTAGDAAVHGDYDGDGLDDLAVFRPSDGTWYIANSAGGTRIVRWGTSGDVPVPGDYDGDGRVDIAIYRSGVWYILGSTSGVLITSFGLAGDTPLPATHLN